jgi:copper(I)-binding protein
MDSILRPTLLILIALLPAACGSGGGSPAPDIRIEGGWARAAPFIVDEDGGGGNSAVYLTIRNPGEGSDCLIGGETASAGAVQLHESRVVNDVMSMQRLDGVEIPAGGAVELKPGGLHLMLLGLREPLIEGEEIDLILRFRFSGDQVLTVPVQRIGGS